LRRAVYDWVLYRTNKSQKKRKVAAAAFQWLFKEEPGHPAYDEEVRNGTEITSFLSICDALDMAPSAVRRDVSKLVAKDILNAGRPPEHRKIKEESVGDFDSALLRYLVETHRDYAIVVDEDEASVKDILFMV